MAAAVAGLLLVMAAAPASAGFRYVPPAVDVVAAEAEPVDPAPVPATPPEAAASGPSAGTGQALWRVRAGEMLRAALGRWGERAGVRVLFLTDRRYRLDGAAAFEGGLMDAVEALFRGLSHLPHAPVAARPEGGTTLVVTHRPPHPPDEGDER